MIRVHLWGCLAVAVVGLVQGGCSLALQTDEQQCEVDADCAGRGQDFAGTVCVARVCQEAADSAWSCVGRVTAPTEADPEFRSTVRVSDLLTGQPPAGATIRLCQKFDPTCSVPRLDIPVPADGIVTTTVPATFTGFYLVESPLEQSALLFLDTKGPTDVASITLLTPAASSALIASIHTTQVPDTGSVSLSMFDCNLKRAAGVHFSIDTTEPTTSYYTLAGTLSPTATATDPSGGAGFVNLPQGSVTITATLESTGQVVGRVATLIRPNAITYQTMRPTPLD
ncbi:MAG: hypothetical protein EOO74_02755 [Myxococcales bacterium]|nr:MAG: hypothetical protein EOO74_02755 [Myxococcales bacterium]